MIHLRKIVRLFIPALLAAVVLFFANLTTNQHYHILASGELVKHAHPLQKNGDKIPSHHQHSRAELILLDLITGNVFLDYLFITPVIPENETAEITPAVYIPQITVYCYCPRSDNRAPPYTYC